MICIWYDSHYWDWDPILYDGSEWEEPMPIAAVQLLKYVWSLYFIYSFVHSFNFWILNCNWP